VESELASAKQAWVSAMQSVHSDMGEPESLRLDFMEKSTEGIASLLENAKVAESRVRQGKQFVTTFEERLKAQNEFKSMVETLVARTKHDDKMLEELQKVSE